MTLSIATVRGGQAAIPTDTKSEDAQKKADQAKKRDEAMQNIPKNALIGGAIFGGLGIALRKLGGASTAAAIRDGVIGGTLIGGSTAMASSVSYLRTSPDDKPGYVKGLATAAGIGITGIGFIGGLMAIQGALPVIAGRLRGGALTAGAETLGKGALSKYGKDLTEAARTGEIGRAFGVDDKVDELVAILGAKRKNNPLIVGPAGTGKTALVEELAHRIAAGEVPDHLKGVRLVQLDLDAMVGGTQYRGMFEQRLSSVLKEIEAANGKIVPFIDETHKLVNAGAANQVEGAGEAVKPLLARGKVRLIGATTDAADEIGKIHADPALARRFSEMTISEPTTGQTLDILRSAAPKFEQQGMRFTDDALNGIVELTTPIVGRNQPDKALTMLDTTASRVAIARDAKPKALKELEARIATAQAELGIVSREQGAASVARTRELHATLDELTPQAAALKDRWSAARTARDELSSTREALAAATDPADVTRLTARVKELEASVQPHAQEFPSMFASEITREDVAATTLPAAAEDQLALRQGTTNERRVGFHPRR